jgi:hypothetical protein
VLKSASLKFFWLLCSGAVISTLAAVATANAFIILPPDCRDKNEVSCLLKHQLDYIFIYDHITFDEYRFFKQLDELWPEDLPLPTIYLESLGGGSAIAMFVGRILHKRNAVVVSGNPITKTDGYSCDSACAMIAAGATERHMNEVGFHQIHLIENYCKSDQLIKTVSEGSNDRVYEYLDDVGADPAIKDYCRNTPYYELLELEFSPDVISTIARH